jgi:single-stranded-DNA-specific exonuclease
VPELRRSLDLYARARLTPADFDPVLHLDGELALSAVTPELYRDLLRLAPFGMGNPEPRFAARGVRLLAPPRWLKEKHAKLRVADPNHPGRSFPAMGWRMAERLQAAGLLAGDRVDIAFKLEHNSHPEFGGLELCLEDIAVPAPSQPEHSAMTS